MCDVNWSFSLFCFWTSCTRLRGIHLSVMSRKFIHLSWRYSFSLWNQKLSQALQWHHICVRKRVRWGTQWRADNLVICGVCAVHNEALFSSVVGSDWGQPGTLQPLQSLQRIQHVHHISTKAEQASIIQYYLFVDVRPQ